MQEGNRDAFRPLVEQYQSLICALSYSASGNVSLSEDIAQETFLVAWKQLPQLRETGRFKAWLCGIARNLIQNHLRRDRRSASVESFEAMGPVGLELRLGRLAVSMLWPAVLFASLSLKTPNFEAGLVVLTLSAGMVALCCSQCFRARSWRHPVLSGTWLGLLGVLVVAVHLYLPAWRDAGIVEAQWTPARTEWILTAFFGFSSLSWRRYFVHQPLSMPITGRATSVA